MAERAEGREYRITRDGEFVGQVRAAGMLSALYNAADTLEHQHHAIVKAVELLEAGHLTQALHVLAAALTTEGAKRPTKESE